MTSVGSPSTHAPVTVLDSPSIDEETLIPTWDDADDIIRHIFDDDGDSYRGDEDFDDWDNSESSGADVEETQHHDDDDDDGDNDDTNTAKQSLARPPWLRPMLPFARNRLPVISSDESTEHDNENEGNRSDSSSSDGADSNAENNRNQYARNRNVRRAKSSDFRFSLPKHLLKSTTNPTSAIETASVSSLKQPFPLLDVAKAIRSPTQGELVIRGDLLRRHQLQEALDLIRGFGYPTRRLVVEEVHHGASVEALLMYLLEVSTDNQALPLRSLRYTGSWMSPTVIAYLVSNNAQGIEELELGLSLFPKAHSNSRRTSKKRTNRTISRNLQRLEDLEEAVAANMSLRVLHLLPCCHVKVTEGLVWAASCHPHLERIAVTVPLRAPQNTADVHESGILVLEGLSEVIHQSTTLADLSLCVDPTLCLLRKNSREPPEAKQWKSLADSLAVTESLVRLQLEFQQHVDEAPSEVLDDMNSSLMQGISLNSSLQSLELVNVPDTSAVKLWYGVHARHESFRNISLTNSPDLVSYLSGLEDDIDKSDGTEESSRGWRLVSCLQVDQASLTDNLFGLELLSQAGGLEKLVVTGHLSEKKIYLLLEAVKRGGNKIQSLVMGHDSLCLLYRLKSDMLESLELRGGRYPVSADSALTLLDSCPSLRRLQLTNVKTEGDWENFRKYMEKHSLECLEITE